MDYNPWFWPILDRYRPLFNYINFWKNFYFGHFWAKSMDYSPWCWPILDRFRPQINYPYFWSKLYFVHFWANSMDYGAWFWPTLDPFGPLIMLIFGINYILVVFEQKAWTIAHDFYWFLTAFEPLINYANFLNKFILVIF